MHWELRIVVAALLVLLVWQLVSGAEPSSLGKYTEAMALAIAALSLNLLFGFNGQISLGHSTFAGIAAFFLGYSVRFWDNRPFVSLIEACVLCFVDRILGRPARAATEGSVPRAGHVGHRAMCGRPSPPSSSTARSLR